MNKYEEIAINLQNKYYDYYCTVYFGFLVEVVENAINDLLGVCDLEDLHQHIIENYI